MKTSILFNRPFRQFLLNSRIVADRSCREKTVCVQELFFFPKNPTVYEIMWEKYGTAGQAKDDKIIRCMRIACRLAKATNTY
jgi:hypothetical protein